MLAGTNESSYGREARAGLCTIPLTVLFVFDDPHSNFCKNHRIGHAQWRPLISCHVIFAHREAVT